MENDVVQGYFLQSLLNGMETKILDQICENTMLVQDMFFKEYSVDEVKSLPVVTRKEVAASPGYI